MYLIDIGELESFLRHVRSAWPKEGAGLLLADDYGRYTVLSFLGTTSAYNSPTSFRITDSSIDSAASKLRGSATRICGCAHSHNFGKALPSSYDFAAEKGPCALWLIYSVPYNELKLFFWDGKEFHVRRLIIISLRRNGGSAH